MKLAIVTTHPIQYYAPVFALLANQPDFEVKVFYGWQGLTKVDTDPGFGTSFAWDIPLLEGYDFEFVPNVASDPGSHHFAGIDCPALCRKIEQWGAEAVLVYGWSYRSHLRVLKHFHRKIPVLFRGDSTLIDPQPWWKKIARRIRLSRVYRYVDRALYVGTNNRQYYLHCGLRDCQLTHAPHAIDNRRFAVCDQTTTAAAEFRKELGLHRDDRVLMFVGKFESKKSPDKLLRCFRQFMAKQPGCRLKLVFVGTGPMEQRLKEMADENVVFAGFRNQSMLPGTLQAADVVALPSSGPGETWGLVISEAMAAGRAVLTSDRVGCAIDLVHPGDNGWIFSASDESALTDTIRQIAKMSSAQIAEMGCRSRQLIEAWTFESQAAAIFDVCERHRRVQRESESC